MHATSPLVDRLASLLDYPGHDFRAGLDACLRDEPGLAPFALAVRDMPLGQLQELYTETFELNAACTLDMGWHLFGDRPERGAFMADLRLELAAAGIGEHGELPDYLPHLLMLISRIDQARAAALRRAIDPAIQKLAAALRERGSPYESVLTTAVAAASREA